MKRTFNIFETAKYPVPGTKGRAGCHLTREGKGVMQTLCTVFFAFCTLLSVASLQSCSESLDPNSPDLPHQPSSGAKVYFSFNITTTSTPSTRDSQTEYWDDEENNSVMDKKDAETWESKVSSIAVVLVDQSTKEVLLTLPMEDVQETDATNHVYTGKRMVTEEDEAFANFLKKADSNGDIKVELFVVCNYYDADLLPTSGQNANEITLSISNLADLDNYGSRNTDFLMTNADFFNQAEDVAATKYYKTININELRSHSTENDPYILNNLTGGSAVAIPVQRALARIDLKLNTNDYYFDQYGRYLGTDYSSNWSTSIKLEYVGLVNINKNFNLFKEAGVPGQGGAKVDGQWKYFQAEMPRAGANARYVFDPKYSDKKSLTAQSHTALFDKTNLFGPYFTSYFYDSKTFADNAFVGNEGYDDVFDSYSEINGSWLTSYDEGSDKFYVWRYLTPNTIHESANQKTAISTGIVFVSRLNFRGGLGQEGTLLNPEEAEEEMMQYSETPIYVWSGKPIGTNYALQNKVKNPTTAYERSMAEAYLQACAEAGFTFPATGEKTSVLGFNPGENNNNWIDFTNFSDWDYIDGNEPDRTSDKWTGWYEKNKEKKQAHFRVYNTIPTRLLSEKLVKNGFSIYMPTNPQGAVGGSKEYMCYYYAWIRHNDNGDPAIMGPMEFGVVRNNIYQISVSSIQHLGHPFPHPDIETDPEAPQPGEDDELLKRYIDLNFDVKKWNVKINDNIGLGH